MNRLLRISQNIPFWALVLAFAMLRAVKQSVDAWHLKQNGFLLVAAWCQAGVVSCLALGVIRYRTFSPTIRMATGVGAGAYATLASLIWAGQLGAVRSLPLQFALGLALIGFWGIALVYLGQGIGNACRFE